MKDTNNSNGRCGICGAFLTPVEYGFEGNFCIDFYCSNPRCKSKKENNKKLQTDTCGHNPYFCMNHCVNPCGHTCDFEKRTAEL